MFDTLRDRVGAWVRRQALYLVRGFEDMIRPVAAFIGTGTRYWLKQIRRDEDVDESATEMR